VLVVILITIRNFHNSLQLQRMTNQSFDMMLQLKSKTEASVGMDWSAFDRNGNDKIQKGVYCIYDGCYHSW